MVKKYNLNKKNRFKNVKSANHLKSKLAYYLRLGLELKEACVLSGVSKTALVELRLDPDFDDFIEKSYLQQEVDHLKNIKKHSNFSWQASSWMLERLNPEKYGKKDTVKHEYEIKLVSFQKTVIQVINEMCPPNVRKELIMRLRSLNEDDQKALPQKADLGELIELKAKDNVYE
jgi:hypothetical protein